MTGRPSSLALTDGLPERRLEEGERLFEQDASDHSIVAVLVDGSLRVEVDGDRLPDVSIPGSFVGEIGALLGIPRTADVVASEATTVRIIGDPAAFFGSHPALALELARQLAGRLHRLTSYVSDVRAQFADADGHLAMVDSVLTRLAYRPAVDIEGGSDRSPDY
jgi:CRP-like cAMP-binding protein